MSLKAKIEEMVNSAMKEHRELELSVFRLVKSAIKNTEIEKGHELSDDEVTMVLEKQAKQRRDSISQYKAGNRAELAEKEQQELDLIEALLPEKMSEEDVRAIVKAKITENPDAVLGKVMGVAMAELKGKADGGTVQKIVKEEMGQ